MSWWYESEFEFCENTLMFDKEIDTPGHTASVYESYPDYVACYNEQPWSTYANGQLIRALS